MNVCGRWKGAGVLRWGWMRIIVVAVGGDKTLLDPCGPWVGHRTDEVFNVVRDEDGKPVPGTKRITAKIEVLRCEKCGALWERRFSAR